MKKTTDFPQYLLNRAGIQKPVSVGRERVGSLWLGIDRGKNASKQEHSKNAHWHSPIATWQPDCTPAELLRRSAFCCGTILLATVLEKEEKIFPCQDVS